MPIVGPIATNDTSTLGTVTSVNIVAPGVCTRTRALIATPNYDWWHSTIFVTSPTSLTTQGVPDLTTIYTYPPECADRWMLSPLYECVLGSSTSTFTGPQNFTVFSRDPSKGIVSDPIYKSCQRYSTPTYSPGVCPNGHTVAEVTAYQSDVTTGLRTFWQASCCKSGMTFGPEYPDACISQITAPLRAHALVTPVPSLSGFTPTPVYEYTLSAQPKSTIASIVTVTTGIAIADPIVVGWQEDDLKQFPTDYAKSLAQKIGVSLSEDTPSPSRSTSPTPPDKREGLSTAAKAGIGGGVALGAISMGVILILILLRRRRKRTTTTAEPSIPEMEDQDHDHAGRKWYFGGRWRSEAPVEGVQNELDSKTVHVVPGPPAELDGSMPQPHGDHQQAAESR